MNIRLYRFGRVFSRQDQLSEEDMFYGLTTSDKEELRWTEKLSDTFWYIYDTTMGQSSFSDQDFIGLEEDFFK